MRSWSMNFLHTHHVCSSQRINYNTIWWSQNIWGHEVWTFSIPNMFVRVKESTTHNLVISGYMRSWSMNFLHTHHVCSSQRINYAQSGDLRIYEVMKYELSPYPPCLFESNNQLHTIWWSQDRWGHEVWTFSISTMFVRVKESTTHNLVISGYMRSWSMNFLHTHHVCSSQRINYAQSGDLRIYEVMKYELSPYPTCLFESKNQLRTIWWSQDIWGHEVWTFSIPNMFVRVKESTTHIWWSQDIWGHEVWTFSIPNMFVRVKESTTHNLVISR